MPRSVKFQLVLHANSVSRRQHHTQPFVHSQPLLPIVSKLGVQKLSRLAMLADCTVGLSKANPKLLVSKAKGDRHHRHTVVGAVMVVYIGLLLLVQTTQLQPQHGAQQRLCADRLVLYQGVRPPLAGSVSRVLAVDEGKKGPAVHKRGRTTSANVDKGGHEVYHGGGIDTRAVGLDAWTFDGHGYTVVQQLLATVHDTTNLGNSAGHHEFTTTVGNSRPGQ
jgi:hypothetical protein